MPTTPTLPAGTDHGGASLAESLPTPSLLIAHSGTNCDWLLPFTQTPASELFWQKTRERPLLAQMTNNQLDLKDLEKALHSFIIKQLLI